MFRVSVEGRPIRANILTIAFAAALFFQSGCATPPQQIRWRTADEGSFSIEIPASLRKQQVQQIYSHRGAYRSPSIQLEFDEAYPLGPDARAVMGARHNAFARAFTASPQDENSRAFVRPFGNRYALFTVNPDEHHIKVFIPDSQGGYLLLTITYVDPADIDTALRIAKSVKATSVGALQRP